MNPWDRFAVVIDFVNEYLVSPQVRDFRLIMQIRLAQLAAHLVTQYCYSISSYTLDALLCRTWVS